MKRFLVLAAIMVPWLLYAQTFYVTTGPASIRAVPISGGVNIIPGQPASGFVIVPNVLIGIPGPESIAAAQQVYDACIKTEPSVACEPKRVAALQNDLYARTKIAVALIPDDSMAMLGLKRVE